MLIYQKSFFETIILKSSGEVFIKKTISKKNESYQTLSMIKNGKDRTIHAIDNKSDLYKLQKNLVENFLDYIPLPDNACGFVKGKSYKSFLEPHVGANYYLRLDIKDFFPSIKKGIIEESLKEYITINNLSDNQDVLNSIIDIVTYKGSLPQGGVSSPVISNLIFRRPDIRIRKYCDKFNIKYTRYADDLLFSSESSRLTDAFFTKMITKILKDYKFEVNRKKIKRSKDLISLNGFVIEEEIRISRKKIKELNLVLYHFEKDGIPKNLIDLLSRMNQINFSGRMKPFEKKIDIINYLAGYRSFLIGWKYNDFEVDSKKNHENINKRLDSKIKEIELTIKRIDKLK